MLEKELPDKYKNRFAYKGEKLDILESGDYLVLIMRNPNNYKVAGMFESYKEAVEYKNLIESDDLPDYGQIHTIIAKVEG